MPSDTKPELDPFIVMIDTKIAALQQLRSSYVAAQSVGALGAAGDVSVSVGSGALALTGGPVTAVVSGPVDLPRGAFLGKTAPAAIKMYLAAARQKRTNAEIREGLKAGGIETLADNIDAVVNSALHRLKKAGEVLRFDDGWALAEFYPESFRNRLAEGQPSSKKPKKKSKPKAKKESGNGARPAKANVSPLAPTLDSRVAAFLAVNGGAFTLTEIAEKTSAVGKPIGLAIARLIKAKRVIKSEDGKYRAA